MNWLVAVAWVVWPCLLFAEEVRLADEGRALLPVVISENAPPEMEALAEELAEGLGKISGASFVVERNGRATKGIFIGTEEQWPGYLPEVEAGLSDRLAREDYLLRSGEHRLLLVGRTPLAVQNAVWDLMYRLGFRQYFPGPKWELWPRSPSLAVDLDTMERPHYATRRLRVGGVSTWPENRSEIEQWKRRNRMVSGFTLSSGHVYGLIVQRHADVFAATPGLWTGTEREPKLDASRPEVLDVVAEYVRRTIQSQPERDSVSLEPSDGGGWREDSPLGSPSNQAVALANHAAKVLREIAPGRKVGIYAYHLHSPPPEIEVDRDVVVGVATSFIKGGYTVEALMEGWQRKGASIGVREYLGVSSWDFGLPGRARASDPEYLANTISRFYALGARYWDSEVTEVWGVHGPGHYLVSRFLWNSGETARKEDLLEEFYTRSFGSVAPTMRKFYETCLFKSGNTLLSEELLGRMYRLLDEALQQEPPSDVAERILDLALYTRFVELMLVYQNSSKGEKEVAFREVVRLVHGNRETMMFDRPMVFRAIPGRAFGVAKRQVGSWLESTLATAIQTSSDEVRRFVKEGVKNYPPLPFESVAFSKELQPAPFDESWQGKLPVFMLRGTNRLYLFKAAKEDAPFQFTVTAGLIYRDRGNVELCLYSNEHPVLDEPVATASIPPDQEVHEVTLASPYAGAHTLEISDGSGGVRLQWPKGQRAVLPASPEEGTNFHGTCSMVFYVPEGTRVVGGYSANRSGKLVSPSGAVVYEFSQMNGPGYFSVDVAPGEGGNWWSFQGIKGRKLLMTVPPFLARSPEELLIPAPPPSETK